MVVTWVDGEAMDDIGLMKMKQIQERKYRYEKKPNSNTRVPPSLSQTRLFYSPLIAGLVESLDRYISFVSAC